MSLNSSLVSWKNRGALEFKNLVSQVRRRESEIGDGKSLSLWKWRKEIG